MTDKFHTQCHRQLMEEKMSDKFPDMVRVREIQEALDKVLIEEGRQQMKSEIVKWLLTLPTDDYSAAGMADRIDKEF